MGIDRKLYLDRITRFERWLQERNLVEAGDYRRFVNQKIESLARQLAVPVDRPSWGPEVPQAEMDVSTHKTEAISWSNSNDLPPTVTIAIDKNLELSERIMRYLPLYVAATILGVLIMVIALSVDFLILNEFWTRAMFPDFARDLADDFGGSALAKSLQVVFATIAFHFFLSTLGPRGRKGFIWGLFGVSFFVILGLGILNASVTAPGMADAPATNEGIAGVLEGLGLADADPVTNDSPSVKNLPHLLKSMEETLWILIPSVIFLIVTGIATLSLQMAETNLKNIVRSLDWPKRRKRVEDLEEMQIVKDIIDRLTGNTNDQNEDDKEGKSIADKKVVAFPAQ